MNKNQAMASLIFINVFWGLTTIMMQQSLQYMSSLTYVGLRMLMGGSFIFICYRKYLNDLNKKTIKYGLILGFLLVLKMESTVLALNFTSATNQVFISELAVLFVPVYTSVSSKKLPPVSLMITILTVFTGIVIFADALHAGFNTGDLIAFGNMLLNSVNLVCMNKFTQESDPRHLALVQQSFAGLACFALCLIGGIQIDPQPYAFVIIIATGLVGTGIAFLLQLSASKCIAPTIATLVNTLNPIFSLVGARLIPDRFGNTIPVQTHQIIGATIILGTLVTYFSRTSKKR